MAINQSYTFTEMKQTQIQIDVCYFDEHLFSRSQCVRCALFAIDIPCRHVNPLPNTHSLARHAACEWDLDWVEGVRIWFRRGSQSTYHLCSFLFFYCFSSSASRYHCHAICRIIKRLSTLVPSLFLPIIYSGLVHIDVKIFNCKTNCGRIDRTTSSMTMNAEPAQKIMRNKTEVALLRYHALRIFVFAVCFLIWLYI